MTVVKYRGVNYQSSGSRCCVQSADKNDINFGMNCSISGLCVCFLCFGTGIS